MVGETSNGNISKTANKKSICKVHILRTEMHPLISLPFKVSCVTQQDGVASLRCKVESNGSALKMQCHPGLMLFSSNGNA